MYVIFFSTQGPANQIAVPKGRGLTGKLDREKVLEKLEQCYSKHWPKSGIKNIKLHNTPSYKAGIVTELIQQGGSAVVQW